MSNNTQVRETRHFDLHTTSIDCLNRIREVSIHRGEPLLTIIVVTLHGAVDNVEYSYIDCKMVDARAEKLVRRCKEAVGAKKKVPISLHIGDIWADPSTYEKGGKKGQSGASLKGRLFFTSWIKVDGTIVHDMKEEVKKAQQS